jgi:hypothetical protein
MLCRTYLPLTLCAVSCVVLAACVETSYGPDQQDADEVARREYLGLDNSISKSLALGFAGFNTATSADIAPQMMAGDAIGTITITGQVDQGASANKGMRLRIGMVGYSDGKFNDAGEKVAISCMANGTTLTFDTATDTTMQPALTLMMMGIPTGTFTGTLAGLYHVTGDIAGDVTLNLTISGTLQDAGGGNVATGTTTVTGTLQSDFYGGTYNVGGNGGGGGCSSGGGLGGGMIVVVGAMLLACRRRLACHGVQRRCSTSSSADGRSRLHGDTDSIPRQGSGRTVICNAQGPGSVRRSRNRSGRAGDCDTVKTIATEVQRADASLHDVVFAHEIEIARCLASP